MPEEPAPSQLVQHVILTADGGQSTGQVLYAQGRNSEGYIVYGPSPPDNQAQVYLDHNIPESDQTVITQEPIGNMAAEPEEQQPLPVQQVQQVIVEQIASQETLVDEQSNVTRIIATPQQLTQEQLQNNVLSFDSGQVMSNDSIQEIDLTVKQEGQIHQQAAVQAAAHVAMPTQVSMPLSVVHLQQPAPTAQVTEQELDLSTKTTETVTIIAADHNSIPAKKRKYIETE